MKKNRIETQTEGLDANDSDWIVIQIGEMAMLHIMSPEVVSDVDLNVQTVRYRSTEEFIEAIQAIPRRSDSRV